VERYEDPADALNGPKYHTGKTCIERGCDNPTGTHWSPFWCQPCNANRLKRIGAALEREVVYMECRHPIQQALSDWLWPEAPLETRRDEVECPSCKGLLHLTQTASLGRGYARCSCCGHFELQLRTIDHSAI
jgi:hypothetical protein